MSKNPKLLEQMWQMYGWGLKEEHPELFSEYLRSIKDEL